MMTQAFYTGISGIRSNQSGIDIVADNLANISTVGFRGSEYEFASLFESSLNTTASSSSNTVGVGSRLQATKMSESQGALQLTDRSTDLAIQGEGWFGVTGNNNTVYTRDGSFHFDSNNDLVTADGYYVLGTLGGNIENDVLTKKLADIKLAAPGAQEKLRFPKTLAFPPEPTKNTKFIGNIGSENVTRTIGAGVVDGANNKNHLKLTLNQSVPQVLPGSQWDVVATTETLDGNTIFDTKNGVMNFASDGSLISSTLTTIDNNGSEIKIDVGSGFDGIVALSNNDITSSSVADGTIGGSLEGYTINKNGEVIATFSNGEQSSVGQLAVYHFQNDQGLNRVSGTKFQETQNSGEPLFYKDAAGEFIVGSDISNFVLESSNIEMSYGLTELIILQRAFDANSKSVTTADQMMQKALNMDA
ncbi:flagellar hook protein FlgE [Sulfurimonas sp. SAG-AH-194-I05]|nr:flagellar hook-basal body complex protein [Sulfurimonas sp. SAG-AH-194-I05]MDF1875369.1 flagellar hook protein FlgE [Sulfurimonas sp. SAG-AH-194-I05]